MDPIGIEMSHREIVCSSGDACAVGGARAIVSHGHRRGLDGSNADDVQPSVTCALKGKGTWRSLSDAWAAAGLGQFTQAL